MIEFSIGRWTISLFNFNCFFHWCWRRWGYDGLWWEYGFGFLLQLEQESDYMLELAEKLPPPSMTQAKWPLPDGWGWGASPDGDWFAYRHVDGMPVRIDAEGLHIGPADGFDPIVPPDVDQAIRARWKWETEHT